MNDAVKHEKTPSILISADFTIRGIKFTGAVQKDGESGVLLIGAAKDIKLRTLFGDSIPDLELDEVSFAYQTRTGSYYFRTALGAGIDLSNLPFVGTILPADQTILIDNLAVTVRGRGDIQSGGERSGTANGAPRVGITADIRIGGKRLDPGLELRIGNEAPDCGEKTLVVKNETGMAKKDDGEPPAEPESGKTKWFAINKSLGPVTVKRIGMRYDTDGSRLFFMLDASMALGPVSLAFAGLGVKSALKAFKPQFMLEGLGISYARGGILISGALFYDDTDHSFTGCAIIKTPFISLAALGGYQNIDGQASLFIYAVLSGGAAGLVSVTVGPVFLQVTGISAGFGINRDLKIPDVYHVKEFPLVSAATGDANLGGHPLEILNNVKTCIPAVKDKYFLAFGVKFNIQKIVDCFALVTVRLGGTVGLDIMGVMKVALPTQSKTPLAQLEMAYMVAFNTEEGAVQIRAVLTPASFIFTRECRLTGGFAFYAWFYGEHAGDFVFSIGGYHPLFTVPAHYPGVPRVGLQWQVIPALSIKGELYCALTPSAMMAGGMLQAVFQCSGTASFNIGIAGASLTGMIRASFTIGLDMILSWHPFWYHARVFISVGVEVVFRGRVRFLFFSTTVQLGFDIHLNADLRVWGPEFTGIAHVNWAIVSFDIAFGNQKQAKPPALTWQEFKDAFLPADTEVCTVAITDGITRHNKEDSSFVVNPAELALAVNSVIPVTDSGPRGIRGNGFGIGSMGIGAIAASRQTITILRDDTPATNAFTFTPIRKSVPAAMWGNNSEPALDGDRLIDDMLVGFRIAPPPKRCGNETETLDGDALGYEFTNPTDAIVMPPPAAFLSRGTWDDAGKYAAAGARDGIMKFFNYDKPVSVSGAPGEAFRKEGEIGTLEPS